jgi:hypothetical protein
MKRPKFLSGVDLKMLREHLVKYGGDGWTIWSPEKFTEMGFDLRELPIEKHESGTGKHQITKDGEEVSPIGVWNLQFLQRLAHRMDVNYASFIGRGFQARAITEAVLPKLDALIKSEENDAKNQT